MGNAGNPDSRCWRQITRVRVERILRAFVTFLAMSALGLGLCSTPEGQAFNDWALESCFWLRGRELPPSDVVLVGIAPSDFKQFLSQGWLEQGTIADALTRIADAHPKGVFIDFELDGSNTDPASAEAIMRAMRGVPTALVVEKVANEEIPQGKERFVTFNSDQRFRSAAAAEYPAAINSSSQPISKISFGGDATGAAFDPIPLWRALSLVAGHKLPHPRRSALINFYGGPGTIQNISLSELMSRTPSQLRQALADKYAFLGFYNPPRSWTMKGSHNVVASRWPMFETEIRANIAANVLHGSWIRSLGTGTTKIILLCLFAGVSVVELAVSINARLVAVILLLANVAWGAYISFAEWHFWFGALGVFIVVALARLVWLLYDLAVSLEGQADNIQENRNFRF